MTTKTTTPVLLDSTGKALNIPGNFDIKSPDQVLKFAKTLQAYVKDNKLTTDIRGKQYVNVEGWQFAGAQLGLIPIIDDCSRVINAEDTKEIKYEAYAHLERIGDGKTMGKGYAICSNREQKKRSFDEYAIASMAQTRVIGKVYRLLISWLMTAAGYEGTPTEELEPIRQKVTDEVKAKAKTFDNVSALMAWAASTENKDLHKVLEFRNLIKTIKNDLNKKAQSAEQSKNKTTTEDPRGDLSKLK